MNLKEENQSTILWPKRPETEAEVVEQLKKTPLLYGSSMSE